MKYEATRDFLTVTRRFKAGQEVVPADFEDADQCAAWAARGFLKPAAEEQPYPLD